MFHPQAFQRKVMAKRSKTRLRQSPRMSAEANCCHCTSTISVPGSKLKSQYLPDRPVQPVKGGFTRGTYSSGYAAAANARGDAAERAYGASQTAIQCTA